MSSESALSYEEFISGKRAVVDAAGFDPRPLTASLFAFQADIVRWAIKRGRAAVFADTGLGKMRMELEWAHQVCQHTGGNVLILAPLAVTFQIVEEGKSVGIEAHYRKRQDDATPGITVANYERLEAFDLDSFVGIVLDESSILKSMDGKTRTRLIEAFAATPYRLAGTATPAPNDHTELGNHAEFLGVCTRTEMLATYFVHDGGDTQSWRLKGHAEEEFWRWVCSWAVAVRMPSDLGHSDDGYVLPALTIVHHTVQSEAPPDQGTLFAMPARTLDEQRAAKRGSLQNRVAGVAGVIAAEPDEQWLVWCDLNDESDALAKSIAGAVEVRGSDTPEDKSARMMAFAHGEVHALVSKSSICGFGMNWQNAARMAFAGVNHSYEAMYQAIRREWRFGQKREVIVHVFASELESEVVASLRRKEADHARMSAAMVAAMRETQIANVRGSARDTIGYAPCKTMCVPSWLRSEEV